MIAAEGSIVWSSPTALSPFVFSVGLKNAESGRLAYKSRSGNNSRLVSKETGASVVRSMWRKRLGDWKSSGCPANNSPKSRSTWRSVLSLRLYVVQQLWQREVLYGARVGINSRNFESEICLTISTFRFRKENRKARQSSLYIRGEKWGY